jgi:putative nucleotidyltransferase-like protein
MWPECITDEQWSVYRRVITDCQAAGLRFAVGGGLAIGVYTEMWRDTKDIDLYVLPQDREVMRQVLNRAGLVDFYDQLPYDRSWIYRSVQDKVIVDVIWAMANYKTQVDERWILDGPVVTIRDLEIRLVPPEEMIWAKLYVLQRERCDWPDVLNIIHAQGERIDWNRLLQRLADDAPLLHSALRVFRWLCPTEAKTLPSWLRRDLGENEVGTPEGASCRSRADLLDRRTWFNGC